ncbi:MAG: hypothetical protein HYS23_10795 [Geobacter sp.]|nr:hypothetical protein [Geobacter sp.]
MKHPADDIESRKEIWRVMQYLWMDTDPNDMIDSISVACAKSCYKINEIEAIYWNEVWPAVKFNRQQVIGEWVGFDIEWLSKRILEVNQFGKPLPIKFFDLYTWWWWIKLKRKIEKIRKG